LQRSEVPIGSTSSGVDGNDVFLTGQWRQPYSQCATASCLHWVLHCGQTPLHRFHVETACTRGAKTQLGILGKFLSERSPGFSFGFPQKRRRRDLTEGELKLPQPCGAVAVPEELEPQPDPDEEELPIREAFTDRERLNQIRKRGKKIMLVMADDLERMLFMAMLHQDGYRCFFEASSLVQALNHQRKVPLDLLVVDQVLGHMEALNIIDLLRDKGLPQEVPVLVVRKKYDVRLTLAAKAGKVSLLLERPLDFAGVVKPAVEGMFRLQADA